MACYLVRVMKRSIAASERQFAEAPVFVCPGRCYAGAHAIGSPYPHYVWEGYPKQRTCLYRKLDSAIMVMKSAEDGRRYNVAHVLDGAMDRSILVERPMSPQLIIVGGILRQNPA